MLAIVQLTQVMHKFCVFFHLNLSGPSIFGITNYLFATILFGIQTQNIMEPDIFWTQNIFGQKSFLIKKSFWPKLLWHSNFVLANRFMTQRFSSKNCFEPKIYYGSKFNFDPECSFCLFYRIFFNPKLFCPKFIWANCFYSKMFLTWNINFWNNIFFGL